MRLLVLVFVVFLKTTLSASKGPTQCEVCRLFSIELGKELEKTQGSTMMMETGHRLDATGNLRSGKIPYRKSELRLIEALEQVCGGMYSYELQTEDESAFKYHRKRNLDALAKLMTQLSDKTSKLGIPNDMESLIDPDGNLKVLKSKCNGLIEDYEDDITEWYLKHQESVDLTEYLCAQRVAKGDQACLSQELLDTLNRSKDKETDEVETEEEEEINADEDESEGNGDSSEQAETSDDGNKEEVEDPNEATGEHTEL